MIQRRKNYFQFKPANIYLTLSSTTLAQWDTILTLIEPSRRPIYDELTSNIGQILIFGRDFTWLTLEPNPILVENLKKMKSLEELDAPTCNETY